MSKKAPTRQKKEKYAELDDVYTLKEFENTENGNPILLETYGKDHERVLQIKESNPRTLWTIVDTNGVLYAIPGYHYVDRFVYVVSEEPWKDEDEVYLWG